MGLGEVGVTEIALELPLTIRKRLLKVEHVQLIPP
jgi:hypothetical protein